jgi:hypothetical protein
VKQRPILIPWVEPAAGEVAKSLTEDKVFFYADITRSAGILLVDRWGWSISAEMLHPHHQDAEVTSQIPSNSPKPLFTSS